MISMTMEADNFETLVKNLCAMLDKCGALDVAEVQQTYKLTYSMLWQKMGEHDVECGYGSAMDIMQRKYNAMGLSELPLDDWHEYYEELDKNLEEKRYSDQTDDLLKELAW